MPRHSFIRSKPSRVTAVAAAGTVLAGTVTAAVTGLLPAVAGRPAAAGPAAGSPGAADLARAARQSGARRASDRARGGRADGGRARSDQAGGANAGARADHAGAGARSRADHRASHAGTPQQIASALLPSYGWSPGQFDCLNALWTRESGWNSYATNPSSGAYGIPQALPAWKMASAGADWQTNPATQIRWGLRYIRATYGSPCGAWRHETGYGWY